MKIACLNIRHGGGARKVKILDWLEGQAADFIILTEWRNNISGQAIRSALESQRYTTFGESRSTTANGVLLASKKAFLTTRLTPNDATGGEIVAAELEIGVSILCCYFPQLIAKQPFFDACTVRCRKAERPVLLIGDLNTGSDEVDKDSDAVKFSCADRFDEMTADLEMIDLWRRENGSARREYTWRSAKNGFRIDHAFANKSLIASASGIRCWYDHSTREAQITDHSGLLVEFDL